MKKNIVLIVMFFVIVSLFSQNETKNKLIFDSLKVVYKAYNQMPTPELLVKIGLGFLNSPYVANTLELNKQEQLIVNLSEFDCTTFAENCLAIAKAIKSNNSDFIVFENILANIRYRNGLLTDYNSRLHYFSDWIFDNDKRRNVKNITCDMGKYPFNSYVDYMSKHTSDYKMLNENPKLIPNTAQIERLISVRENCYIPKNEIAKYESMIQDGDIIGITTNIIGMDMSHVVIAYHTNGRLQMLHASSKQRKVVVSSETLTEYIQNRTDATGIMVARPL